MRYVIGAPIEIECNQTECIILTVDLEQLNLPFNHACWGLPQTPRVDRKVTRNAQERCPSFRPIRDGVAC